MPSSTLVNAPAAATRLDRDAARAETWLFQCSSRRTAVGGLMLLAATALLQVMPDDLALLAAAKVVVPPLVVGLLPGLLMLVCSGVFERLRLLEVVAISLACSLPLVQGVTFLSLLGHVSCARLAMAWSLVLLGVCLALCRRRSSRTLIVTVDRLELAAACTIFALACLLYVKGSPFFSDEEQFHISVIRRLAFHPYPAINNIYYAPDIIFTHPFPGTHYFMALVSRLGAIDPLFAYHKLRWFWTLASFVFLYVAAWRVFADPTVVGCVFAAAVAFALNGTFADFSTLYWAQLLPYSHPSDLAMSVFLPGLLVMAFSYYSAEDRRQSGFFLAATLGLLLLVTVVHIRETVQFLVYNGSFLLGCLLLHRDRRLMVKIVALCAAGVVLAGGYGWFHHRTVEHVAVYDQACKTALWTQITTGSLHQLFVRPALTLMCAFQSLFNGWHPLLLLASPLVFLAFRQRPLALLIGMSSLMFLVLIRLPVLSMCYVYCTYHEMLMTPLRNISYFHYLIAGAALYLLAMQLARIQPRSLAWAAAAAAGLYLGLIVRWGEAFWTQHADVLLLHALGLFLAALVLMKWLPAPTVSPPAGPPAPRWRAVFAVLLGLLALATVDRDRSPLDVHTVNTRTHVSSGFARLAFTPAELVEKLRPRTIAAYPLMQSNLSFASYGNAVVDVCSTAPSLRLMRWAESNLSVDSVLTMNSFNGWGPATFLPQQCVAWPAVSSLNLSYVKDIFPRYYDWMDRVMATYRTQPFFNDLEAPHDRRAYLRDLRVTHVLLDPAYYDLMKRILEAEPETYRAVYDDGQWAVFAVKLP